jgi:hypothetical protein
MEVTGELHAPIHLLPGKQKPLFIFKEFGWTQNHSGPYGDFLLLLGIEER